MRKFLRNIGVFGFIVLLTHIILGLLANGTTDNFYSRFTSPKQGSLIIGTSRAAQGIVPSQFEFPVYNFAFTVSTSPFSEGYLQAIKEKLDPSTSQGKFIVAVDPWALSIDTTIGYYFDDISSVGNMKYYNCNPNFEYLLKHYKKGWGSIALNRMQQELLQSNIGFINKVTGSYTYLHSDGWLEVFTNMDSTYVRSNIRKKVKAYENQLVNTEFSEYRYENLIKTISYLQKHGEVILVRMPVHQTLIDLEEELMPEFDDLMTSLATRFNLSYLNYIPIAHQFSYTDGNHLYSASSKKFSQILATHISK